MATSDAVRPSIFPPAQWLKSYSLSWLPRDLLAGVTLELADQ